MRGGGRRRRAAGTFRRAGGLLQRALSVVCRSAPLTRSQVGHPRGSAAPGSGAAVKGRGEGTHRHGGDSASLPPCWRLPLRAVAPARLGPRRSGSLDGGTGLVGRRELGCAPAAPARRRRGADMRHLLHAGAERASPAACCRDLGGGWCPGIDQPPVGSAWARPARTSLQRFAGAPFSLTYFCLPFSPLVSPSAPRCVYVRACVPGRGGEGSPAAGRSGAVWRRATLAAFDVSFECRSLSPLLAPSICSPGGGPTAFKGALPAAAATGS